MTDSLLWLFWFAGRVSTARSAEFLLPSRLAELVLGGMELGAADDLVSSPSKPHIILCLQLDVAPSTDKLCSLHPSVNHRPRAQLTVRPHLLLLGRTQLTYRRPPQQERAIRVRCCAAAVCIQVFGRVQSGQGSGTVGKLTNKLILRADYYEHAAVMALIPFMNLQLYSEFGLQAPEE